MKSQSKNSFGGKRKRVALYGGVFDPVHQAHLAVARAALVGADVDSVVFLPAAQSPHKEDGPLASDDARLAMLRLATEGEAAFTVDGCELDRGGVSYSVDTVAGLARLQPEVEFCWILGADQWEKLNHWRRIEELSALVEFLVVARPGYSLEPQSWPGVRHRLIAAPLLAESSSEIRQRLASGLSISGLVAPAVEAFISANNLYS
ncbi:MAG: nicotinate-nucleotide adenylyltransferase [Coraliomargaritaceae bacterium]